MKLKHQNQIIDQIAQNRADLFPLNHKVCVGLSGGIDSIVLLHMLKHITPALTVSAIHVNHGISPNAQAWAVFCQKFCSELNIPLHIENINLQRQGGESLENIARIARYNVLFQTNCPTIALAHHQNDQAETILSQLFRGSDPHNIAAMRKIKLKQGKLLWRPLLQISRTQIEEYAALFKLKYIVDESNFDTKFLRGFVRHEVLPLLSKWDRNILPKLLNFNSQLQRTVDIADEIGTTDLRLCCSDGINIDIKLFEQLNTNRQINLLVQFIKTHNLPLPGNKQLTEFTKQITGSSWDKKPQLNLNANTLLIKYKNNIYLSYTRT